MTNTANVAFTDFADHAETPQADPERMSHEEFMGLLDYVRINGYDPRYLKHLTWKMTNNQRAILAATLADRPKGNNKLSGRLDLPPTRIEVQNLTGISIGSMDRAKATVRFGTDDLVDLTAAGRVALTTAARVARLPHQAQGEFVTAVRAGRDPVKIAPEGWRGEGIAPEPAKPMTMREARYRFVQESAMRVMGEAFTALGTVLDSTEGLDPGLTAEQAATWRSDLSRRAKNFRRLMALLNERQQKEA